MMIDDIETHRSWALREVSAIAVSAGLPGWPFPIADRAPIAYREPLAEMLGKVTQQEAKEKATRSVLANALRHSISRLKEAVEARDQLLSVYLGCEKAGRYLDLIGEAGACDGVSAEYVSVEKQQLKGYIEDCEDALSDGGMDKLASLVDAWTYLMGLLKWRVGRCDVRLGVFREVRDALKALV